MASSVANVFAAMPDVAGALRRAPLGTDGPVSATDALDNAFVDLGYIGEDGFTESNSRDTTKKKAFGGSTVKILQTDYSSTITFTFLESLNADVLRAVFGDDNVTVTPATETTGTQVIVDKNKATLPHASWVIDTIDGDARYRSYVPDGQITSIGDITVVHTDTIAYQVTIECFETNIDGKLVNIRTFADDGVTAA